MTIEALIILGGVTGFLSGLAAWSQRAGCALLALIPLAMIAYVAIAQALHPESLRSTSGLDYVFGALWPTLGAVPGFGVGLLVRSWWSCR
ncbi:hypothetical protein ACLBKU_12725 [Erythrobacter sp. NE805]|uniref:hypothetical protein n=1 Tax=Erythrobacter sp. NE805 TaxID=3389875 RepID=UPI00396B24A6